MSIKDLPSPDGKYNLEECLASGAYGKVYRGKDAKSNWEVAIKVQTLNGGSNKYVEEEYKTLKQFTMHQNLPDFYGAFKLDADIWFVLELCEGGTVRNMVDGLLMKNRHMTEEHIAHILKEAVKALIYLHKNHIIHRNVKCSNLLLTKEGDIKLCDFGISRCLDNTLGKTDTSIGSPCWMAPEQVTAKPEDEETRYGNRVDVWALGITGIELGDGKAPYEDTYPTRTLFQIVRNPPPTLALQSLWSNNYNDFLNECLIKNPEHRPYMEELIGHPLLAEVPENSYHLSLELKSILNDLKAGDFEKETKEVTVNGKYLKCGAGGEVARMYIEDLAALDEINESRILNELQARMEKGEFQTFIGDILLILNPNEERDIYSILHRQKYKCKSRSQNAPHIYAVADSAYQDALHHNIPQKILLAGEAGAGKTSNYLHLLDQLLYLGDNVNINIDRIKNAVELIHALTHASTPYNDFSTRCIMKTSISYGDTGKVSGAEFGVYFIEKWRVSSVDMSHSNFHFLYYIYDGLNSENALEKYKLQPHRQYRYMRIQEEERISKQPKYDIEANITKFAKIKLTMEEYTFNEEQIDLVYKVTAAVIILGDVKFKDTEDGLSELDSVENVELVAELLGVDSKKLAWALCNYCLFHNGVAHKGRLSTDESRDARDVLANNLYSRLVDYIVAVINQKLDVGKAIFGDKYLICILDYFGFECFDSNHLPQLFVNTFNEQMQYHYLQRLFGWEISEMLQDGVQCSAARFHDNKQTLDQLLSKQEGVMTIIDDASKMIVDGRYVIEHLEKQEAEFVTVTDYQEFSVMHYTGRVKYIAKEMPDKNRDFLPTEVIETMRQSDNSIIKHLFTTKLNRVGNAFIRCFDDAGKKKRATGFSRNKQKQPHEYSQITKMRTAATVFRAICLELLKEFSAGAGFGGVHFVRCVKTSLENKPNEFHIELIRQQLRALAVVETAKLRRDGYPYRVNFAEFLRRYKFLAFDFNEMVDMTKDNCRLLLIRLKMEGWVIGKTKVFLKYYNEECLSRLYESQVKKIIKIQSILRGFLIKCRMKRGILQTGKKSIVVIRRKGSVLTEEEAAAIIQQAYRKSLKRKASQQGIYKPLSEDEIEFITPFAKKWRSKSIYQVLGQLRAHYYQQCFDFCIQVHLYNAQFYFDMLDIAEESVDLDDIDESATAASWIGEPKPSVLKMPFRLDDIPYYDTTRLTCDPLTNVGVACEKTEPWDAPYRFREMLSTRPMSVDSDTNSNGSSIRRQQFENLANLAFNRDPDKPVVALPVLEDEEQEVKDEDDTTADESDGAIEKPNEENRENGKPEENGDPEENGELKENEEQEKDIALTKQEKEIENQAVQAKQADSEERAEIKIKPQDDDKMINSNTKPANKDFDYIKPNIVNRPRVDPVAELRNIVRKGSLSNEDDPPFNFQGMLRKTNFKRDSLKKAVEEVRSCPFKTELKSTSELAGIPKVKEASQKEVEKPLKTEELRKNEKPEEEMQTTKVEVEKVMQPTEEIEKNDKNEKISSASEQSFDEREVVICDSNKTASEKPQGVKIETELLPGFFISGIEYAL